MGVEKKKRKRGRPPGLKNNFATFDYDKPVPLPVYIKNKIKLLKDFNVRLTAEQRRHIEALPNELAVDRYARTLIDSRLSKD
jgi:hypothetical protein